LLIDASSPHGVHTDISLRARQELLQTEKARERERERERGDALKQQQKAIAEERLFGISSLQRQLLQVQHEREAQVQYEADLHQHHDAVLRGQTYKTYYTPLHPHLPQYWACERQGMSMSLLPHLSSQSSNPDVIESDLKGAIKSRTVDCRHSNYRVYSVIPHTDMGDPVEMEGGTGLVKVLPRAVTMLLTKSLCC
jgi:hypothetical protein